MLYFENDYGQGAHKKVLEALVKTNEEPLSGYGSDTYTQKAKEKILKECNIENGDVYFISGGTQTNALVIDFLLKSYEGVISANTGHIATHEAGAIEFTGHKVLEIPHKLGKLASNDLKQYLLDFNNDGNNAHMVQPGMVYITHPTEYGTLYTNKELQEISVICKEYNLPLFLDGARLGYALASKQTNVTLEDVARYCDVFYIGGTKIGALCGEALVFTKEEPKKFVTFIKQHGALLAKGRLIGVQFDRLFTDNLYLEISNHAIEMAEILKEGLKEKNYKFYISSPTNQQFIILENSKLKKLAKFVKYSFWEKHDDEHTIIRLATSWYTKEEDVRELIRLL